MEIEIIDHPADIGFRVFGKSLEEAYANSGKALYHLLLSETRPMKEVKMAFSLSSEDLFSLTYDFLEHLLILFETEGYIASNIEIDISKKKNGYSMNTNMGGYYFMFEKDQRKYDVKAITYHMMKVECNPEGWIIQVIVDI